MNLVFIISVLIEKKKKLSTQIYKDQNHLKKSRPDTCNIQLWPMMMKVNSSYRTVIYYYNKLESKYKLLHLKERF